MEFSDLHAVRHSKNPAAVGIVRSLRGLENLVHEGSHFNWSRSDHRLNDLLCNLLAAVPVFSNVVRYRPGHKLHHFAFGTDEDADLGRYQVLGIEALSRRNPFLFAAGIARRIVAYVAGWWKVIQTRPAVLGLALLWKPHSRSWPGIFTQPARTSGRPST